MLRPVVDFLEDSIGGGALKLINNIISKFSNANKKEITFEKDEVSVYIDNKTSLSKDHDYIIFDVESNEPVEFTISFEIVSYKKYEND